MVIIGSSFIIICTGLPVISGDNWDNFLFPSPDHCVQSGGGQQQSITDQEMKQLLVNIHDMMKQIVASQQTNTVLASALPASDSYGNPLASTSSLPSSSSSNKAPDSYGVAQAAPISGASPSASSSRPASNSNAPDSYGVAKAAPISGSSSSSSAPSSYSAAVASSSGVSSDEPVILSTYQQINSALRRYRDTLQHNKQEEVAGNLVNIAYSMGICHI